MLQKLQAHPESVEQVEFIKKCSYHRYGDGVVRDYIFSVPNALPYGGKRAMLQMMQLKREGLTKGVPDLEVFIPIKPYTGLHIEMKRRNGVPSDVTVEQKEMMARMSSCGRKCVVAYGADEAWNALMGYLKL